MVIIALLALVIIVCIMLAARASHANSSSVDVNATAVAQMGATEVANGQVVRQAQKPLGGITQLAAYCQALGYAQASIDGPTAFDWHCVDAQGHHYTINMDAACRWQYGRKDATAVLLDYNTPDSWLCYAP